MGKTPSYKLDVNGDIATYGTLRIASDERLKTNVQSVSIELKNRIYDLEAKAYNKQNLIIDDTELNKAKGVPESALQTRYKMEKDVFEYGFIAQELKEVFPELVSQDKDGYYTINYIGLIPLMVEALKEQNERNETPTGRNRFAEKGDFNPDQRKQPAPYPIRSLTQRWQHQPANACRG